MMSEVRRCVGRDAVLECGHSSGGQPSQDFQKLCQTVKPLDSSLYICRHVVLMLQLSVPAQPSTFVKCDNFKAGARILPEHAINGFDLDMTVWQKWEDSCSLELGRS